MRLLVPPVGLIKFLTRTFLLSGGVLIFEKLWLSLFQFCLRARSNLVALGFK